jgi:hypothetical protein
MHAGRLERHGDRGNHDADPHLALGHLQDRLEQGGDVFHPYYVTAMHALLLMHACVLMTELQVEKAKVRLDKWEDTKQPLLED